MQQKYLYVLFSATPYRMGQWIRRVTGEPYNHVALATEENLSAMYAFARRYYRTPFYGGFVQERPCRYRLGGVSARVQIYRLPLTSRQWDILQERLHAMQSQPQRYLYNHLSALAAPLHRKVRVRDAFTCAEFAVSVLSMLGFDFDPNRFYTIGAIARRLEDYHIYTGDFPETYREDPQFFAEKPLRHPIAASTQSILALLWRKAFA